LIADVKIAVVTGGAHGIGRALCERLAQDGVKVVVADLDEDAATVVAADIDGVSFKVDVGDEAGMTAMIESVEETVGPIDIFFSNAGLVFGDGKSGAARTLAWCSATASPELPRPMECWLRSTIAGISPGASTSWRMYTRLGYSFRA